MSRRRVRAIVHRIERAAAGALERSGAATLLVALSGGPDSSAALVALHERASRHGWRLEAAHFDHGIARAEVRAAFQAAADDLTCRLGVPLHNAAADVPRVAAEQGLSLETAARAERYAFLARAARDCAADAIVTGHTMDDQAESVLLHLIRGSGIDGLAAMRPRAPVPIADGAAFPPLLRPLLGVRRTETVELCRASAVQYVDDPANRDPAPLRNRIRRDFVPRLAGLNPRIVESLAALADSAAADRTLLDTLTEEAVAEVVQLAPPSASEVSLSRRRLRARPPALQARVLRRLVTSVGGEAPSHERTQALLRLLEHGGGRVECGRGVVADARGDCLRVAKWRSSIA
ncbi:MAG: tRNA lysidine(34) synthetase TilS [Dehalococcoidia bacterium]